MAKKDSVTDLNITGEEMIQRLHEDLAGEYQMIIEYTVSDLPETHTSEE